MLKMGAKFGAKAGKLVARKVSPMLALQTNNIEGADSSISSANPTLLHGQLLINIYSAKGTNIS